MAILVAVTISAGLLNSAFDWVPTLLMVLVGFGVVLCVKAGAQLSATKLFVDKCSEYSVELVAKLDRYRCQNSNLSLLLSPSLSLSVCLN